MTKSGVNKPFFLQGKKQKKNPNQLLQEIQACFHNMLHPFLEKSSVKRKGRQLGSSPLFSILSLKLSRQGIINPLNRRNIYLNQLLNPLHQCKQLKDTYTPHNHLSAIYQCTLNLTRRTSFVWLFSWSVMKLKHPKEGPNKHNSHSTRSGGNREAWPGWKEMPLNIQSRKLPMHFQKKLTWFSLHPEDLFLLMPCFWPCL